MRCRLSELLEIDRSCINIKATTTEGLGFIGRKEGLGAQAVVLLKRSK
jgi:2-C-methyl-D-erythritol 2,4-cyclodiphosphate synthase